jgi:hypothetical protein
MSLFFILVLCSFANASPQYVQGVAASVTPSIIIGSASFPSSVTQGNLIVACMIASLTSSSSPSGGIDDSQNQYTVAASFLWGAGGLTCSFTFAKRSGPLTYSIIPSRFQNSGFDIFLAEYSGVSSFDFGLFSRSPISTTSNCADELAIVFASSWGDVTLDSSLIPRLHKFSGVGFGSGLADFTSSSSNQTIVSTKYILSYDGCLMLLFRSTGPCLQERLTTTTSFRPTTTTASTTSKRTTTRVALTIMPSLSPQISVSVFLLLLCLL